LYCIFHKENDDHSSNYCPDNKRFEAILEEERKEKERASAVNHSAPVWQNPSLGETLSLILSIHLNSNHLLPLIPNPTLAITNFLSLEY
jgi:hypothetical protein